MMRKKPVLFRVTNNLDIGGVTTRLRQVLPLLLDAFEVHVVTYRRQGVLVEEFRDKGIHVHHVPLSGKWSPRGIWALARLMRQENADIVHTHSLGGNISGILAAARAGVRVRMGQVHTRQQHWYGKSALHRRKQRLEEYWIHTMFSHRVLFPSRTALEYFYGLCPVAREKLHVLYNGVRLPDPPLSPEAAMAEKAALRERHGIAPGTRVIGFVARLTRGKGLSFAFDFMGRLRASGRDACLMIVGSSGDEERDRHYAAMAEDMAGPGAVCFTGRQSQPYAYYRLFDAFFFPSDPWTEAMPGAVLEAAMHSLPILSRENPAVREVAEYYPGIHFMKDGDDPEIALAALDALPPPVPGRLENQFGIESMAERTMTLYHELLAHNKK